MTEQEFVDARLVARVAVDGRWYGPGDPVPAAVAAKIRNAKVWEGGVLPSQAPRAVDELVEPAADTDTDADDAEDQAGDEAAEAAAETASALVTPAPKPAKKATTARRSGRNASA